MPDRPDNPTPEPDDVEADAAEPDAAGKKPA
jgi:hypothetical protein